jgi:hypothetical protein
MVPQAGALREGTERERVKGLPLFPWWFWVYGTVGTVAPAGTWKSVGEGLLE